MEIVKLRHARHHVKIIWVAADSVARSSERFEIPQFEEMAHADEISNSDAIPDKDKAGEPMKLPPIPPTTSSEDEGGAGQKLELLRSA